jgi:hypothetical protein
MRLARSQGGQAGSRAREGRRLSGFWHSFVMHLHAHVPGHSIGTVQELPASEAADNHELQARAESRPAR